MGTKFTVSQDDVNKTKLLNPGWFLCEVSDYLEKAAAKDGSMNRFFKFSVVEEPNAGVIVQCVMNEKFMPLLPDFVKSFGATFEVGATFDLEDTKGRKIMVHVKRGEYNGRPTNEVDGFRAAA